MKVFFIVLATILFGCTKPQLELYILDKSIKSGQPVNVILINKSKIDFCLVIDTLFDKSDENYDVRVFSNPTIWLQDLKGNEIPIIRTIYQYHLKIDTLILENKNIGRNSNSMKFIIVKAGKSLKLKIPFNLTFKFLKDDSPVYYEINRSRKYNGRVYYRVSQNFINNNFHKNKIDSIKRKGYKFFIGNLESNKVPLIIGK